MSRLTRPYLALLLFAGGCATLAPAPQPEHDASVRLAVGLSALGAGEHTEAYEELAWVFAHCHGREAGARAVAAMAALELDPGNPSGRPAVGMDLLADLILDPGTPEWLRPLVRTTYTLGLGLGAPAPARARQQPVAPVPEAEPDTIPSVVPLVTPRARRDTVAAHVQDAVPTPTPDTLPPGAPDTVASVDPDTIADAALIEAMREAEEQDPDAIRLPPPERVQEFEATAMDPAAVHGCGPLLDATGPADATLPALPGPSLAAMLEEAEAERAALAARTDALQEELAAARRALAETRGELDRIRRTLRP